MHYYIVKSSIESDASRNTKHVSSDYTVSYTTVDTTSATKVNVFPHWDPRAGGARLRALRGLHSFFYIHISTITYNV